MRKCYDVKYLVGAMICALCNSHDIIMNKRTPPPPPPPRMPASIKENLV